jgi:hypothetical protein
MTTVRVRSVCKTIENYNVISGHRWSTNGPTISYEVIGGAGVSSKHTSEVKANTEAVALQEFYDKFGL